MNADKESNASLLRDVSDSPTPARPRLILLGASNLTRGFSTVVETARLMFGSPLEIVACLGHGRSFGMHSTVLGRTLPGILECGIWDALQEQGHQGRARGRFAAANIEASRDQGSAARVALAAEGRTPIADSRPFALITDIGNDIMYGASPETIAKWVEECVDRLQSHGANIAMTALPIKSIRIVRRWQYEVVRAVLFPMRRITFEQAIARAIELHERIVDLAARRQITLIECEGDWYGFDPIHIRMRCWPQAWSRIIAGCAPGACDNTCRARPSVTRWMYLRSRTPQQWRWLGLARGRAQPSGHWRDGSTLALY